MEIKFRGISQATGKFVYGWFKMCGDEYCIHNKTESHYIIKETLGQFTGKTDMTRTDLFPNGQNIYDGDVGEGTLDYGIGISSKPGKKCRFLIKKRLGGWGFEFVLEQITKIKGNYRGLPHFNQLIIIGNKWQNPKLLND